MNKTRLVWIDSLKGWLMLLVVMGHAIQYCMNAGECESNYWWNLIYSFHMPAFMALSGFVNYRSNKSTPPPHIINHILHFVNEEQGNSWFHTFYGLLSSGLLTALFAWIV